ncbi:MAG: adenylate/guanylate cyclase domain-containing protein [Verrucomicrobiota bacterium]
MEEEFDSTTMWEMRLFLEEICCNLCRFQHVDELQIAPVDITIHQEAYLALPGAYADISVQVPGAAPYFVEVKYGYPASNIISHVARKYGSNAPRLVGASKLVLVVPTSEYPDWPDIQRQIESRLQKGLKLEIWDEPFLFSLIRKRFNLEIDAFSEGNMVQLKAALDHSKGHWAFGDSWKATPLQSALLWSFGFWKLKQFRELNHLTPESILPPGMYKGAVAVLADLCSFSSYVRDTRNDAVIRQCLTSFYSKARYEILNSGGMIYQFVGDEVIGLYGIPRHTEGYQQSALECAKALVDLGNSISHQWQRQIDRIQTSQGVHIGVAMGDIQVVSLQPFGRAHIGAVSDAINMANRLLAKAGSSEIVVSNTFIRGLDEKSQTQFREIDPVDARNLGTIRAWKTGPINAPDKE